jgi:hypothetical protein
MVNRIGFALAVVLGTSLLGGASIAAGQEKAPGPPGAASGKARPPNLRELSKVELVKLVEGYRLLMYSPPQNCLDQSCDVPITTTVVTVMVQGQNIDVCVAQLPSEIDFTNTNPGNAPLTITWKLNPSNPNPSMQFHATSGILTVFDPNNQLNPDNSTPNTQMFKAQNKHKAKAAATYVPVILYQPSAGQPPGVCATGDPQIVNN